MKKIISTNTLRKSALLILALVGLVFLVPQISTASVQSEYDTYKIELRRLQEDAKKSQLRHYWLNLAGKFYNLYEKNPTWANRTAALYRAGEAYDELAKRSFAKQDRELQSNIIKKSIKNFHILCLQTMLCIV